MGTAHACRPELSRTATMWRQQEQQRAPRMGSRQVGPAGGPHLWRPTACPTSCPSTKASESGRPCTARIRPLCTKTMPPGRQQALTSERWMASTAGRAGQVGG